MEDSKTPAESAPVQSEVPVTSEDHEDEGAALRPGGWKYKERQIGSVKVPWYASPKVQLTMVSFVCFLCPGMFNALNGMGGGGRSTSYVADRIVSQSIRLFQSQRYLDKGHVKSSANNTAL